RKVKNAQEAHEAIRPAGDTFRDPAAIEDEINQDEFRLYELIWRRTVASQMNDARGRSVQVRLGAEASDGRDAEFAASGKTILFPGFLRAYVEGSDDPEGELEDQERFLPDLEEGDAVDARSLEPKGHETQPPARFTEASLVRRLEELGVGRPSTYASIISTIQDRGYVWKKGSALVPSFTAFAVVTELEQHLPDLVDYAFTARMEDDLDGIAAGQAEAIPWLSRFYFGEGEEGLALKEMVEANLGDIDARAVNSIPLGADSDGVEVVARVGRYGPYLQRGDDTASIPDDIPPDELTIERAVELVEAPSGDRALGTDPETGLTVLVRNGRFGPYIQLGDTEEIEDKPKTGSLFADMDPATIDLETALKLLSLPRSVGVDPADGEEILVQNGRYGPYLKKGKETRSIDSEAQLFTITLEQCLKLLAEPKKRGRQAKPPLKELGEDPVSGGAILLKDGRRS
ncbi:MAG: DNA topoisomerase, partial [Actinomycetota bacterium]